MAILITRDKSGCKRYFAGFFADNTICWSTVEENALDKTLGEFRAITNLFGLEQYNIRERISRTPTFRMP